MSFDIRFTNEIYIDPETGTTSRTGEIRIGNFREGFVSLQSFWNEARYKEHWCKAVKRIVRTEGDSCLVTSIADATQADLLFWRPLYREGDQVFVQSGILLFEQLEKPFDPDNPFASVPPRTVIDEDGQRVSEWSVHIRELEEFLNRRCS
jgi:hypothetical protein